jgi:hypothetical protein
MRGEYAYRGAYLFIVGPRRAVAELMVMDAVCKRGQGTLSQLLKYQLNIADVGVRFIAPIIVITA